MESLPMEMLEKIFSKLEVGDLLSCASVSTLWRNAANDNRLWKKHCEQRFCVDTNSKPLIEAKSHVEPRFEIPANRSDRLADVCSWRIRYAQEVHISNNFTNGRYGHKYLRIVPNSFRCTNFQIGDKIVSVSSEEIGVWNTEKDSSICLNSDVALEDTIKPCLPAPVDLFLPMNNGFSFIQKNIISHYSMKNGKFFLKLQTAIQKPLIDEKMPNIIDDIEKFSSKLAPIDLNELTSDIIYNERYVIISNVTGNVITFIVWDVKTLQSSVFYVPFENEIELIYKELSGKLSSKLVLSFFETSTDGIVSDTIFTYDSKNPGTFVKTVVEPMNDINIRPIDDFIAIGYKDKLTFVRGGKTASIKCDISGSGFEQRVIKTASYICALGRHGEGENLELLLTDLDFNLVKRYEVSKSVGSYTDYSLHTIGQDFISVGCLPDGSLPQHDEEVETLVDLKGDKSTQLPPIVLAFASPMRRSFIYDPEFSQVYYFW